MHPFTDYTAKWLPRKAGNTCSMFQVKSKYRVQLRYEGIYAQLCRTAINRDLNCKLSARLLAWLCQPNGDGIRHERHAKVKGFGAKQSRIPLDFQILNNDVKKIVFVNR